LETTALPSREPNYEPNLLVAWNQTFSEQQRSDLALLATSSISTGLLALLYQRGQHNREKTHRYSVLGVFLISIILSMTKIIADDVLVFIVVPWMMVVALGISRWIRSVEKESTEIQTLLDGKVWWGNSYTDVYRDGMKNEMGF
jgi:hypothetical protein